MRSVKRATKDSNAIEPTPGFRPRALAFAVQVLGMSFCIASLTSLAFDQLLLRGPKETLTAQVVDKRTKESTGPRGGRYEDKYVDVLAGTKRVTIGDAPRIYGALSVGDEIRLVRSRIDRRALYVDVTDVQSLEIGASDEARKIWETSRSNRIGERAWRVSRGGKVQLIAALAVVAGLVGLTGSQLARRWSVAPRRRITVAITALMAMTGFELAQDAIGDAALIAIVPIWIAFLVIAYPWGSNTRPAAFTL
jgi:hypothetical protein